jgi:alpha-galactosidase
MCSPAYNHAVRTRAALALSLAWAFPALAHGQAAISRTSTGWTVRNDRIALTLVRGGPQVHVQSLARSGGPTWIAAGTPIAPCLGDASADDPAWKFVSDDVADVGAGRELTLRFTSSAGGALSLLIRVNPTGAVLELRAALANTGSRPLAAIDRLDPLCVTLDTRASASFDVHAPVPNQHGFYPAGTVTGTRTFNNWIVVEQSATGESALIGGEPGLGILQWGVTVRRGDGTNGTGVATGLRAGNMPRTPRGATKSPSWQVEPGQRIETPMTFVALAKGDADAVGNEAFRYLKRYVFPPPVPNTPLATYTVWLTEADIEETLLREAEFAKRVGFDVFYHDASWFEGASVIPGMNDWAKGLGSYADSREKFPRGLAAFSEAVRAKGLKFGIWVDPANVDAARVEVGEIPHDWLAMIDGQPLKETHPSLTVTRQLCLGNAKVVAWLKTQLSAVIERFHVEWVKWDPSATVSYACDRVDHGHGRTTGAWVAYRGRAEILDHLMRRHPHVIGFECDPSLQFSRTNPGPREVLPGGYTTEFMTGPMVSPTVWGSLAAVGRGDARGALQAGWYSASALDYHFRKHLTRGIAFGNINGMTSQFLSAAPPGYVEAFKRNLLHFKRYRSLLLEDVYHPRAPEGWSALQYVAADRSESVLFVFRDKSDAAKSTIAVKGLDPQASYRVTSLNDRPGRERTVTGAALLQEGLAFALPDPWLASGDGLPGTAFEDQLRYGSDLILLRRVP